MKTYRKASNYIEQDVIVEAGEIASKLNINNYINCTAKTQIFVTVKE